jgi:hypothetical protein
MCDCKCTIEGESILDVAYMVEVDCTAIGQLPPLLAPKKLYLKSNIS